MTEHAFVNGKVFTGRNEIDFATAFGVSDGVITWVGDTADARNAGATVASTTRTVTDLEGRTVLPGFLDVHTHPAFMAALVDAVTCLPPEVNSLAGLLERLGEHPNLGRGNEGWIDGFGYDESTYPEGRGPTADDLDQVSATQPVLVRRCDGHSAACNHRALELAGITADTPDPAGAAYERDAAGRPTGVLTETAATDSVAAMMPPTDRDQLVRNLARLNRHFTERGIVAVADLLATEIPAPLDAFRHAERLGLLPQCALYYGWTDIVRHGTRQLADDDRIGRVKVAGVKVFMDGAYSNRTAWTVDDYPGTCAHGMQTITDEELRRAVRWARNNLVQVAVHAMGDRALGHVLDMFGDEDPWMGDLPSIRLDHATLFSAAMIEKLNRARMSFAVVSHSIFMFAEYDSYHRNLSPGQFDIAYPVKSFYDRVPYTALSSDSPTTAWADADNVFVSVKAAVLREAHNGADIGRAEAITVPQALLLYTGRARQVAALDGVGLIAPGNEGSFVVLDRDVFTVDPHDIDQVRVDETWIRGERVFVRPGAEVTGA